jgi:hypothetical protein
MENFSRKSGSKIEFRWKHRSISFHQLSPAFTDERGKCLAMIEVYIPIHGEPLWLSGKVMEWDNIQNQKIPGSLPSPGNLKKCFYITGNAPLLKRLTQLDKFYLEFVFGNQCSRTTSQNRPSTYRMARCQPSRCWTQGAEFETFNIDYCPRLTKPKQGMLRVGTVT